MGRASLVVAVLISACIEPKLVSCPDDTLCPVGTQCDTVHRGCISPDQAQVCVGLADREPCRAGSVVGYCLDQICVDPKCGNYIVEAGELCDDGNRVDGDGCSATCQSREKCGDGALDRSRGEACDDGNLLSHDGCDSQCLVETPVWTVDPIGPSRAEPQWTTYDPQLGKVVLFADGYVWAWDGEHWSTASTGGPRISGDYSVVYDSIRMRLVVIAAAPQTGDTIQPNPLRDHLYEWDGTTWVTAILGGAPAAHVFSITYDDAHRNVFAFGTTTSNTVVTATLDLTNRKWTATTPSNAFIGALDRAIAFDEKRKTVVVVASVSGSAMTGEWDGTAWTLAPVPMAGFGGWSAFYDPTIARVVVLEAGMSLATSPVQSWTGTTWADAPAVPRGRFQPSVAFDATRNVRVVFGGGTTAIPDDVVEGTSTTWTTVPRTTPPPGVDNVCNVDEGRHRVVCVGAEVGVILADTWTWVAATGTWSQLPDTVSETPSAITYDPVRGAIVAVITGNMIVLGDTGWQLVDIGSVSAADALVFDPTIRQLVVSDTEPFSGVTSTIFIDEQNQTRSIASPRLDSMAYDALNHAVVGTTFSSAVQLGNDTWATIVSPGAGFKTRTNARRGTVEFVGSPHDVERVGVSWIDLAPAPIQIAGSSTFDQATGELFALGADGISRFMLHRRWESATPFEDCTSGSTADTDGDGLAGCDDPDCWTTCRPACPPLTTCP